MASKREEWAGYAAATAVVIALAWGATVLGKNLTYKFFYEQKVRETVEEVLAEKESE